MADELTDFERRTLENGWIERDFTGIRLAVAQILAARVAAALADERKRIDAECAAMLTEAMLSERAGDHRDAASLRRDARRIRAALGQPTEGDNRG